MSSENFSSIDSEIIKKIYFLESAFKTAFPGIYTSAVSGIPIFLSVRLPEPQSVPSTGQKSINHEEKSTSTITHERDKTVGEGENRQKCTIVVTVDVAYTPKRDVSERNNAGHVTKFCYEYEVKITVKAEEHCIGTVTDKGTSTHTVPTKKICDGDPTDRPTTENTSSFDGSVTDTLTYPHGTKVVTKTNGNTTTITVTYPDGVTETLSITN